jgi:hypothetical protein
MKQFLLKRLEQQGVGKTETSNDNNNHDKIASLQVQENVLLRTEGS